MKVEKKELELLFGQYQHAWECCEKGGNFTSQGYCSYEWQDKVHNNVLKSTNHFMTISSNFNHGKITHI